MQTKIYRKLFTFSIEYSSIEYVNNKMIKSCGTFCRYDDAHVSNLMLITTALCNNLGHLHLTWRCIILSTVNTVYYCCYQ